MAKSTHAYAVRGATLDERLRHAGWTEVVRVPALGPCWEWSRGTGSSGYGKLYDGHGTASAHRVAYRAWIGPIPDGLHVCHHCDNHLCIRPAHLFAATPRGNHQDKAAKGRAGRGDTGWQAKITDAQVQQMRDRYTGVRGEQAALAAEFGVSPDLVSLIVRGLHRKTPD